MHRLPALPCHVVRVCTLADNTHIRLHVHIMHCCATDDTKQRLCGTPAPATLTLSGLKLHNGSSNGECRNAALHTCAPYFLACALRLRADISSRFRLARRCVPSCSSNKVGGAHTSSSIGRFDIVDNGQCPCGAGRYREQKRSNGAAPSSCRASAPACPCQPSAARSRASHRAPVQPPPE